MGASRMRHFFCADKSRPRAYIVAGDAVPSWRDGSGKGGSHAMVIDALTDCPPCRRRSAISENFRKFPVLANRLN
jgi:hypothetical protein